VLVRKDCEDLTKLQQEEADSRREVVASCKCNRDQEIMERKMNRIFNLWHFYYVMNNTIIYMWFCYHVTNSTSIYMRTLILNIYIYRWGEYKKNS
jgi:hypothetical protein